MDIRLLALTLDLQSKAVNLGRGEDLPMKFAALDLLDYLGKQIDAERAATAQKRKEGGE